MTQPDVQICRDSDDLAHKAADIFLATSLDAMTERGHFRVALSGGSTPRSLYEVLANKSGRYAAAFPWSETDFFWTDERYVPPDHADSNFRMTNLAMLQPANVPLENVHRVKTETTDPALAAADYEKQLRTVFDLSGGELPRFDLILLGVGAEGHTASIFPQSEVLRDTHRLVAATWVDKLHTYRITFTLPVLNNAALVLFLVSGEEKAPILKTVLQSSRDPQLYPAQAVAPARGRLLWLVDQAAAGSLAP